ncbi:MAG: nucleotidyltransferase family protein [Candidatus Wallbacteria bacterium]|nr:nucleotidyltransferase family protein [Candidatus Wallbacteria bacterium]
MQDAELLQALIDRLRVRGEPPGAGRLSGSDWKELLELSRRHGVTPLLWLRLQPRGALADVPVDVSERLRKEYLDTAARGLLRQQALREVAEALGAAEIPVIVLKGAFLSEVVYSNLAARPMVDLDILVPRDNLAKAIEVLATAGYRPRDPYSLDGIERISKHIPALFGPQGRVAVELHWTIASPRRDDRLNPGELWARRIGVTLGGTAVSALGPEDLLLHVCSHVAYDDEFSPGLRPLCDLAEIARHYDASLDWDVLVERAERWRWAPGVYLALRLARDWLGALVPGSALEALCPREPVPSLFEAVRERLLAGTLGANSIQLSRVVRVLGAPGLRAKLREAVDRVWLDPDQMAWVQQTSPGPRPGLLWHLKRTCQVIRDYGPVLFRLASAPLATAKLLRSRVAIAGWLLRQ